MARPSTSIRSKGDTVRIQGFFRRIPESEQCPLRVLDLGLVPYEEAWEIQRKLVDQRAAGTAPDTLLLLEHPPVVTRGRGTKVSPAPGLPIFEVERGGEVTLHSPGQLVGYPIVYLEPGKRDLRQFLRRLEEVLIRTLADFEIEADRREGHTGVWVGPRKIASIGVACRRWVTYHGFALNVTNDLSLFERIRPCGFDPRIMTSMQKELGCALSSKALRDRLGEQSRREFRVP